MSQKDDNDNLAWVVFGGLIGAALAQPKIEEKKKIQEFTNYQSEFKYYMSVRNHFRSYLNNIDQFLQFQSYIKEINERFIRIRPLKKGDEITKDPIAASILSEIITSYSNGLPRLTNIGCVMLLEYLIKKKFPNIDSFNDGIEKLKHEKCISGADYHFLHGIRSERNIQIHEIPVDSDITDAEMLLNLTLKLIDKIF